MNEEAAAAELKSTVLLKCHEALGAKMVPFSGWNMPVQYPEGILAEHAHTRKECSLFDICHMGEFRMAGKGAVAALDRMLARPVADLPVGGCRYNYLLNDAGGVIDDLIVYRMDTDDCFIVVNAGNIEADFRRMKSLIDGCLTFENLSQYIAKLDLQGPKSAEVLEKFGLAKDSLPGYFHWRNAEIEGIRCILSRTGYTGELGFELYFNADYAEKLWTELLAVPPVKPAGLGARDTLRLEMGYALYGHELNSELSPLDCGAAPLLNLDLPRDFAGKAALLARPIKKQLVGIRLDGRRAARAGAAVMNEREEIIGQVTSGAFAPSLNAAVAMCSTDVEFALKPGDKLLLESGREKLPGSVVTLPFYPDGTVRMKLQ